MKAKNLIILLVLAVCLGLAAYWTTQQKQKNKIPSKGLMGSLALPNLANPEVLNNVEKILIETGAGTVTVAKTEGLWVVPEKENYPANFDRIREFLQTLSSLKVGQTVAGNAVTMEKLGLASATSGEASVGLQVSLWDGAGKPVAALRIGKEHMRNTPDAPEMPMGMPMGYPDGRYVAVDGKSYLVTETFADVPRDAMGWLDNTLLNVDPSEIIEVSVKNPAHEPVKISRKGAESVFEVEGLKDDEQTNAAQAADLAGLFSRLSFVNVHDTSVDQAKAGFDQATTVIARTKDGEIYNLQIGGSPESSQDRYARITVSLDQEAIAKSTNTVSETDMTQLGKEVEQDNQKLSKWTYVVPSYRLNGIMGGRDKFVMKKTNPEPETPPQGKESAVQEKESL